MQSNRITCAAHDRVYDRRWCALSMTYRLYIRSPYVEFKRFVNTRVYVQAALSYHAVVKYQIR